MAIDDERPRLTGSGRSLLGGLLGTALTVAVGAVVLVLAFMFSVLVFGVVVIGGLGLWGYLWWKTRAVRAQLREKPPGGHVIEGEVIREPERVEPSRRVER
jgi:Flp pilus assembly protein TadB